MRRPASRWQFNAIACLAIVAGALLISARARAAIEPGKYLCLVSHLAGIQYESNGQISAGSFKPADDKFFLTIAHFKPLDECPTTKMKRINYWFFCLAKYSAQVDNQLILHGDDPNVFVGLSPGDNLSIDDDLGFLHVTGPLSGTGTYVSDGKCTKVN